MKAVKYLGTTLLTFGGLSWLLLAFTYWFLQDADRRLWAILTPNSFIQSLQLGSTPAVGGLFIILGALGFLLICFGFLIYAIAEKYLTKNNYVYKKS